MLYCYGNSYVRGISEISEILSLDVGYMRNVAHGRSNRSTDNNSNKSLYKKQVERLGLNTDLIFLCLYVVHRNICR